MTTQEYLEDTRTRGGNQRIRDGRLLNDLDDDELLTKMLDRYPGDREKIEDLSPDATFVPPQKTEVQELLDNVAKEKGMFGRIGDRLKRTKDTVQDALSGEGEFEGQGAISRGFQAVNEVANVPAGIVKDAIPSKKVRGALDNAGELIGKGINKVADIATGGDSEGGLSGAVNKFAYEHPEASDKATGVLKTAAAAGGIAGNILAAEGVAAGAQQVKAGLTKTPSIRINGRSWTLDKIHSAEGSKAFQTMSPKDQKLFSAFDQKQSLAKQVADAKGAGRDVSDLEPGLKAKGDVTNMAPEEEGVLGAVAKSAEQKGSFVGKVGETVSSVGRKMSEQVTASLQKINPSKRIEFKAMQGVSEEKWLTDRGIIGTREQTVKQLTNNFLELRQNVDDALDKIPGTHRDARITTVAKDSAEYAKKIEDPVSGRMAELAERTEGVGLNAREINEVKRYYERNVKMGYLKDKTKSSEQVQRATNRDTGIREALLDIADKNGFPELRAMHKDIQANKFLADNIAGKAEGQGANDLFSLSDAVVIAPGLIANPKFLLTYGIKKGLSSETMKAFAARALAGFPKAKPLPRANLQEITRLAEELMQKEATQRISQEANAVYYMQLERAGYAMGPTDSGFVFRSAIKLTPEEEALIVAARARANAAEQRQMVEYILEQKAQGKAVGEGFTVQNVDNTPILNPQKDPNALEPDIEM